MGFSHYFWKHPFNTWEENTLQETNSEFTPENGWLEYFLFFWGVDGLFSGAMLVSGSAASKEKLGI